jgi:heme oxygenase
MSGSVELANDSISARTALREATRDAHARLHEHPLLQPLSVGKISRDAYKTLLTRLYGFHAPLERAIVAAGAGRPDLQIDRRQRAALLRRDLVDLGLSEADIDALPTSTAVAAPRTPGRLLGALYVREGATLGGRQLARQCDGLFGPDTPTGRRFFSGQPDDPRLWQSLCAAIETAADEGHLPDMIDGAKETFDAMELWLAGD